MIAKYPWRADEILGLFPFGFGFVSVIVRLLIILQSVVSRTDRAPAGAFLVDDKFEIAYRRIFDELWTMLYVGLEVNPSILDQSRYQEFSRKFLDPAWRAGQPQFLFAVMGDLLNIFPEVYILLYRVDRIKGDADRFLDPLLGLMKRSKCKVKVFLVASSNFQRNLEGKITADLLESLEELGPKRFANTKLEPK